MGDEKGKKLVQSQSAAQLGKRASSASVVRSFSTQNIKRPQTAATTGGRMLKTSKSQILYPNYDLRLKKNSRAVFGRYPRFPKDAADDEPGPGKYSKENYKVSKIPLGRMGKNKRFHNLPEYSTTGFDFNPPTFRIVGTSRSESGTSGVAFGKHPRFQTEDYVVPGPYNVVTPHKIPAGKMGKAKRFMIEGDVHEQGFTWNPASFSARHNGKTDPDNTGVSFPKQKRFSSTGPNTPGPQYEVDTRLLPKSAVVKFTQEKRFRTYADSHTVGFSFNPPSFRGPSSTEIQRNNSSKFTTQSRFKDEPDDDNTPSVHDYNINQTTLKKGIKLNKANRFGVEGNEKEPGPGDYWKAEGIPIKNGKFGKFARFAKESDSQQVPGPKYDTIGRESKIKNGKFDKQKRFTKGEDETSVGPGSYTPKVKTVADAHGQPKWGKPRSKPNTSNTPGPSYIPSPEKIPGGPMNKAKRFKEPEMRPY